MPVYRPGRTAAQVSAEHGLANAIRLASNEAPFGPLDAVRAAIASDTASLHRYPDMRAERLRTALALRLQVPVSHVTVGAGSSGLLWQLAQAYLDPGDELLMPWPSFEAYPIIAQLMDAVSVRAPLNGFTVDVDALLAGVTARTKVLVVADPNNPTGTAIDHASMARLADATAGRCVLVIDEAYVEFRTHADPVRSLDLVRIHDHVLVLRTFSKAYGLAGLRVGYAIGPRTIVDFIDRVAVPFNVASLGQAAALASLDADDELDARVRSIVAERTRVVQRLHEMGWCVPDAQANFVLLPVPDGAVPMAEQLERQGVITRPFDGLGVRVTIGTPDENDLFLEVLSVGP
jgi:histidinol-phosphate aminotransferase